MYQENEGPIDSLVHLYVDGAFSRRDLIRRVAKHTGSVAAALTVLRGYDVWAQAATPCPADVRVPADAPDVVGQDVTYAGEGFDMLGYMAYPRGATDLLPGVIVIHENRGLVDHHKDVARRAARAGFLAIAPDLLSRQGGTAQFPDATTQAAAYNRTTVLERQADLISTLSFIKAQPNVVFDRIGVVGFCAGGGNLWNLVMVAPELRAAVPFYGTPVPTADQIPNLQTPVLAIYAELDRGLTTQMGGVMTTMLAQQKTLGFVVYQGANHAFHNDTGAAYNAAAACDAWARTIAWFNKYLRAESTA
jgi:carboxymethylenebutenolidase